MGRCNDCGKKNIKIVYSDDIVDLCKACRLEWLKESLNSSITFINFEVDRMNRIKKQIEELDNIKE